MKPAASQDHITNVVTGSGDGLKRFEARLRQERVMARARLDRALGEARAQGDDLGMVERLELFRAAEWERLLIREIDAALIRMATGQYGLCEATGKPIEQTRLELRPWARYSRAFLDEVEGTDALSPPARRGSKRSGPL